MNLRRKKPFLLLATFFSIALLVLACVTAGNTCYDQTGLESYSKYSDHNECNNLCNGRPASKLISFPNSNQQVSGESTIPQPGLTQRTVRCGWRGTAERIFFATASLMVLFAFIEFCLTERNRWYLILNLLYIPIIGMGIVLAIFLLRDLHHFHCNHVKGSNDASGATITGCKRSIFDVSFIFTIVALVLWCLQFIYNCLYRKRMNENDPKYGNIPQQHYNEAQNAPMPVDNRIQ